MKSISQPVGTRDHKLALPNNPSDVETIIQLLDQISTVNGGTGKRIFWKRENKSELIKQLTEAIGVFQQTNKRPKIDYAVDPNGGSLRLMNQLTNQKTVSASIHKSENHVHFRWTAAPLSLNGSEPLKVVLISADLVLKLVSVEGTSIKWFGVVIPKGKIGMVSELSPHIFFTPSPHQGKYYDPDYDDFEKWTGLWRKYSLMMGTQIAASNASQILVIPFYKNVQTGNLGSFLSNWKEVLTEVISTAIESIEIGLIRNDFNFDHIFTSSFSNGIASHQNFASDKNAVAIKKSFDFDGQASGSKWHPPKGVIYNNIPALRHGNPIGNTWYVGQRMQALRQKYTGVTEHDLCPNFLYHGLSVFGN